jgi:hypothetical protein
VWFSGSDVLVMVATIACKFVRFRVRRGVRGAGERKVLHRKLRLVALP